MKMKQLFGSGDFSFKNQYLWGRSKDAADTEVSEQYPNTKGEK